MRTYIVWGKKPGDTFIEWNSTVYIVGMLTIAECCWWSTIWSHTWMVLSRTGSVELVNSLGVRFQMLILLVWFLILWDFTKEFIRYNYWFDKCKKKKPSVLLSFISVFWFWFWWTYKSESQRSCQIEIHFTWHEWLCKIDLCHKLKG